MVVDVLEGVAAVGDSVAGTVSADESFLAADASAMSCMPVSARLGPVGRAL